MKNKHKNIAVILAISLLACSLVGCSVGVVQSVESKESSVNSSEALTTTGSMDAESSTTIEDTTSEAKTTTEGSEAESDTTAATKASGKATSQQVKATTKSPTKTTTKAATKAASKTQATKSPTKAPTKATTKAATTTKAAETTKAPETKHKHNWVKIEGSDRYQQYKLTHYEDVDFGYGPKSVRTGYDWYEVHSWDAKCDGCGEVIGRSEPRKLLYFEPLD